jgi:hypothetical protein
MAEAIEKHRQTVGQFFLDSEVWIESRANETGLNGVASIGHAYVVLLGGSDDDVGRMML